MTKDELKYLRQTWGNSEAYRQMVELDMTDAAFKDLQAQYKERGFYLDYLQARGRIPGQWTVLKFYNEDGCRYTRVYSRSLAWVTDLENVIAEFAKRHEKGVQ